MYTAAFSYLRPSSLEEAERCFREAEDARYVAGGMTLIPTMKQRLVAPTTLIDLAGVPGLAYVRRTDEGLSIGALTRHHDVATNSEVRAVIPALAGLAGTIGDPAVRHRGTIGGSLANNDPAADYPSAALALDATFVTRTREIAADDFFLGMFTTALEEGEVLTEVRFPVPRRAGYAKVRNPASRYAMAGAFVADTGEGIRVAVTGAGPCVFRVPDMEEALAADFTPAAVADIAVDPAELNGDIHGSAEYRANLVNVVARRAVAAALASGGPLGG